MPAVQTPQPPFESSEWAEELHEQTLQTLLAVRMMLATGLRAEGQPRLEQMASQAHDHLGTEIVRLRLLVARIRGAATATPGAP